jgi:hypothetical protein
MKEHHVLTDKNVLTVGDSMTTEGKTRHGCLTAWLILMIISNSANILIHLLKSDIIRKSLPNVPVWAFQMMVLFSIFNLVCAIALFQWKKWGFWGFCLSGIVAVAVNLSIGLGTGASLFGLLGIFILYGVLKIGQEKEGWAQLD